MNNEQRTIRGFTLIELLVAVAILAIVMSFAGVIFKVCVESHRTAIANTEIMQKLRAITDQLDSDFKGLQTDAPLLIWFRQDPNDPSQRYDQIMFFADGDFQSTQLYAGRPIIGNVARIYYGQAQSLDPRDNTMKYPFYLDRHKRLLARRQHILTADPDLYVWPIAGNIGGTFDDVDGAPKGYNNNEIFEHDSLSLAQWKTLDSTAYGVLGGTILNTCFDFPPWVNMGDAKTFHKLMCEGVGNFTIQWAYWDPGLDPISPLDDKLMWFPSDNPDGSGTYSHFDLVRMDGFPSNPPGTPKPGYTDFDVFGVFFNIPNGSQINYWGIASLMRYNPTNKFPYGFYPKALKFTFTLYDSKGVIKNGRTFTHIVYLD